MAQFVVRLLLTPQQLQQELLQGGEAALAGVVVSLTMAAGPRDSVSVPPRMSVAKGAVLKDILLKTALSAGVACSGA